MTFRERVKKAFRRNSDKDKNNDKPKIEYYRRGECPRSKYRGPVDPEHRRKLYDWNFEAATADRERSFELDLSPCTSLPDQPRDDHDSDTTTLDDGSENEPEVERAQHIQIIGSRSITVAHHEVALSGSFDTNSDQSTAVVSSCHSSLTLKESWDWPVTKRDALGSLKDTWAMMAPVTRRISAPEKCLPFDPQELSMALSAVRIVS
ncbi:hypothetical protein TMatcc_006487 [Talaromyces marneffei ATCC 18224]|uniref:Uncharacterized protein n=2 Tax=Talaromyces marneffei TaxID=37727 RepID=B6QAN1_TALMQ|nr:uncharacterized protein EYB26_002576 [Talaromyces marneffei]EEA25289.1 conserved hypothetical protein [Talaromyces marneffei ATCC 18224]KAE8554021.1 hypothetical protein EYB25_002559 [Talaromyces marneffei]QGA14920.1 hypothetical protein EYB26_002576 [Talaromyces marneffei]